MTTAQLYIIHDVVANHILGVPLIARSIEHGIRQFRDIYQDKSTIVSAHPEDFRLLHIGTIDLDSAGIVPVVPTLIINARDFYTEPTSTNGGKH